MAIRSADFQGPAGCEACQQRCGFGPIVLGEDPVFGGPIGSVQITGLIIDGWRFGGTAHRTEDVAAAAAHVEREQIGHLSGPCVALAAMARGTLHGVKRVVVFRREGHQAGQTRIIELETRGAFNPGIVSLSVREASRVGREGNGGG